MCRPDKRINNPTFPSQNGSVINTLVHGNANKLHKQDLRLDFQVKRSNIRVTAKPLDISAHHIGQINTSGGIFSRRLSLISRMLMGRILTKLITITHYQVHMMTFSRSWVQSSRSPIMFPENSLSHEVIPIEVSPSKTI